MSDYRRFIAYLYEYPNNRKGGCCGFVRVESQNGFCRMDFQIKSPSLPPETSVTVYGFIRRSGRMYGIPLGNLLAGRSSTSGKLFTHSDAIGQTDVTLDELGGLILLCRQTGVIATQWDDLPIQPEFFAPTLPQEPKTSADNGDRPTEEKTAETPEPLDPAVPAQSLPSSDASKAQFDELSTEFSSNSELYPQNSSPESTVSTESTSTDTVNTVPADRITQSSANTLYPASAESVKTAESYPSANPEPPQPIPDSTAQPLHMTSADFPAAAAVPPSRAALYLQLQDQFPEFHPFPDDDLTDCLRLSLDDLPQLRAAGLSVDANRFVLHGSSSYRHLLLARNRDQQELWYFGVPGVYTPNEQFMASLFGFSTLSRRCAHPSSRPMPASATGTARFKAFFNPRRGSPPSQSFRAGSRRTARAAPSHTPRTSDQSHNPIPGNSAGSTVLPRKATFRSLRSLPFHAALCRALSGLIVHHAAL